VPDAAFDHFIAASDLPGLEQAVFDGYLRGLREPAGLTTPGSSSSACGPRPRSMTGWPR
jgi:hypothetical protein